MNAPAKATAHPAPMPEPDVFEERDRAKHAHIFPIEGEVIVFRPTGARPDTQTQREPTQ